MNTEKATACRGCNRAVFVSHVDRDGYCVNCAKPSKVDAPKKAEPSAAGDLAGA